MVAVTSASMHEYFITKWTWYGGKNINQNKVNWWVVLIFYIITENMMYR